MSFVSYILTYRDDGTVERRANLVAVLNWARTLTNSTTIVVEQRDVPGPQLADPAGVQWLFCRNQGPFNKSWGLNVGARRSESPVLAFGDADVICAGAWPEAVKRLQAGMSIVKPYCRILDLTPDESVRVRAGEWNLHPPRSPGALPNREAQGEYVVFAGGLFLLRREVFHRVGGFDERFLGWGGEDDAMTMRLAASRVPMQELNLAPALHLWHPRNASTTFRQPFYEANCAILAEYRRYTPAQWERLWRRQGGEMGRSDKYSTAGHAGGGALPAQAPTRSPMPS